MEWTKPRLRNSGRIFCKPGELLSRVIFFNAGKRLGQLWVLTPPQEDWRREKKLTSFVDKNNVHLHTFDLAILAMKEATLCGFHQSSMLQHCYEHYTES